MGNIVESFLTAFIKFFINTLSDMLDNVLDAITDVAFNADKYMTHLMGNGNGFSEVFTILQNFGLALITLMFLKKGFDTYVAWTDDPSVDPLDLVINYMKAMIVALCFSYLYELLVDVVNDLINKTLEVIFTADSFTSENMKNMFIGKPEETPVGGINLIFILILAVCYVIVYIQFLVRGLEILILRVGVPLAACGLINNNKGVFAPYINKLFQSLLSVFVQVVLWKMSFALAWSNHFIWAVAAIVLTIRTPKFLSEFIAPTSSGTAATIRSVGQAAYTYRMLKR